MVKKKVVYCKYKQELTSKPRLTEVQYSHSASEYSRCALLETQDGVRGKVWRGEGSVAVRPACCRVLEGWQTAEYNQGGGH